VERGVILSPNRQKAGVQTKKRENGRRRKNLWDTKKRKAVFAKKKKAVGKKDGADYRRAVTDLTKKNHLRAAKPSKIRKKARGNRLN